MNVLIADDDPVSRKVLQKALNNWGYGNVTVACNGTDAWERLRGTNAPSMAILDWMMPEIDGVQLCKQVRALEGAVSTYIILLTAKQQKDDIVSALEAGADDYVTKPFDHQELRARLRVGQRTIALQFKLAERVRALNDALAQVKQLEGLLPICCYCKRIRDDDDYWHRLESYFGNQSNITFSHGICPSCWKGVVMPELDKLAAGGDSVALSKDR